MNTDTIRSEITNAAPQPESLNVSDAKGMYVIRKPGAKKIYKVECWRGDLRRWQLADVDDISRAVYVKAGTRVYDCGTY